LSVLDELDAIRESSIPVRFGVGLLRELAVEKPVDMPRHIHLISLGQPDNEGFYTPVFGLVFDADVNP